MQIVPDNDAIGAVRVMRSLPVITIADRARVLRDREYAENCAITLLQLMENVESLRGTGRLFIP